MLLFFMKKLRAESGWWWRSAPALKQPLLEGQEYRDGGVELQHLSSSETGMVEGKKVTAETSMAATIATSDMAAEATKTAGAIANVTLWEGIMDRKVVGVMDIWMSAYVKLLHRQGAAGVELAYFKNSSSLIPIRSVMLDGLFLIPDRHGKKQHRIDVANVMGEVSSFAAPTEDDLLSLAKAAIVKAGIAEVPLSQHPQYDPAWTSGAIEYSIKQLEPKIKLAAGKREFEAAAPMEAQMVQFKAARKEVAELTSQLKTNTKSSAIPKMRATEIELLSADEQSIYERIEAVRFRVSGSGKLILGSRTWAAKLSSWEIKFDDLELGEEIGEGAFGKVVRAVCFGVDCAVKVIPTAITTGHIPANMAKETKSAKMLTTEMRALSRLHHPNIIRMLHLCCEPGKMALVLEFAERGNLRQCLHLEADMPTALRFKLSAGVAQGMAKLHRHTPRPIVHHDLKPENILITQDYTAKVADFGTATGTTSSTMGATLATARKSTVGGTPQYMAPEVLNRVPGLYDKPSVDVYAYGVVNFELFSQQRAWGNFSQEQIITNVVVHNLRPKFEGGLLAPGMAPIREMIDACWASEQQKRPTFHDIVEKNLQLQRRHAQFALAAAAGSCGTIDDANEMAVVVSTSQFSLGGKDVMKHVEAICKTRNDIIFGYDWASSTTKDLRDAEAEKLVDWNNPKSIKKWWSESYRWKGYCDAIKGEVKLLAQLHAGKIKLVCIEGGPISQLEAKTMAQLKNEVAADLQQKGVTPNIEVVVISFMEFKVAYPPQSIAADVDTPRSSVI
jgi:serine/threonine protein kinase